MSERVYCTKGHDYGQHDATCMPQADPANPELRLIRAIFGLCPICDVTTEHYHADEDHVLAELSGSKVCPVCHRTDCARASDPDNSCDNWQRMP